MSEASTGSIHVLHVDDELDFAEIAAEFVERQDPRVAVETATNATDGLERIRANGVDCVVSDFDMPGQNGIEFLEAVRKEFPDLPFILYTGKGSEEVAGEAISSGVTDYLQKGSGSSQYEILYNLIENSVEHQRAQEAANETEERLRSITDDVLDATEVGVFILDAKFGIAWCNEAIEGFFGVERTDVIGRDKRQVIEDEIAEVLEDPNHFAEKVLQAYDDNTYTERFDCHVLSGDGRADRWLAHLSHPIETGLFEGGRVEFYTDDTDRKMREQRLGRQNTRLDEFTTTISHDLRNPISVAAIRLEMGRHEHDSEDLRAGAQALELMAALVEDVMGLGRTEVDPTDIPSVRISEVIETNSWGATPGEATTVITMDRDIHADRSQLDQLLENLIRNAAEHGGSDVIVTIGDLPDGFYFEDDGPGIPLDDRKKMFDAGYSSKPEGPGFGLTVVQQVVDAHGWELSVADPANGGARFEVTGVLFGD